MNNTPNAKIFRSLFTDNEWDIIHEALADFQDHIETEELAEDYDNIQSKIHAIFTLTEDQ